MRKSLQISLIAVFGALHAVLYFVSFGLWRNWAIYIESIEGIILGPYAGFMAAFVGSSIARTIRFDAFWMFGIVAEPVSVLIAGFLAKGRWKPVLAAYAIMLSAYFIHPFGRELPLWTILDVLVAVLVIYPASRLSGSLFGTDLKRLPIALILISFVSIATDSLVRIFMLVPCGVYSFFPDVFGSFAGLYAVFVGAALDSYIEDFIVVAVSFLVGIPLLTIVSRLELFKGKITED
jgi:uncharacterized membrane protein